MVNKCLNVLLIEDNLADANLAAEFVRETGFEVTINRVEDGEKAIEFFEQVSMNKRDRPDLVLLDLNLPRRSGHEVLEFIRQREGSEKTCVIIYTGSKSPEDTRRAEKNGVDKYLIKPMTTGEIDAVIEKLEIVFTSLSRSSSLGC